MDKIWILSGRPSVIPVTIYKGWRKEKNFSWTIFLKNKSVPTFKEEFHPVLHQSLCLYLKKYRIFIKPDVSNISLSSTEWISNLVKVHVEKRPLCWFDCQSSSTFEDFFFVNFENFEVIGTDRKQQCHFRIVVIDG